MDLATFLNDRYDETEAVARAASDGRWYVERREAGVLTDETRADVLTAGTSAPSICVVYDEAFGGCSTVDAEHIARWSPAHVLADVAAKRAILALHTGHHECVGDRHGHRGTVLVAPGYIHENDPTLLLLAQPFAGHPDFDPAWR